METSTLPATPRGDRSLTALLRLWGKTTADPEYFHPALYHMLDVGHVQLGLVAKFSSPPRLWGKQGVHVNKSLAHHIGPPPTSWGLAHQQK
jgi:hypothetical protein